MRNILAVAALLVTFIEGRADVQHVKPLMVLGSIETYTNSYSDYNILKARAVIVATVKPLSALKKECNEEGRDFKISINPDAPTGTPIALVKAFEGQIDGHLLSFGDLVSERKKLAMQLEKSLSTKCSVKQGSLIIQALAELKNGVRLGVLKELEVKGKTLRVRPNDLFKETVELPSSEPIPTLFSYPRDW